MAGEVKKLQFAEGTDVGAPSDLGISSLELDQYHTDIGDSLDARIPVNTNLLGDVRATYVSTALTSISNATPAVLTFPSGHGLTAAENNGDRVYLTTSGTLPTGLSPSVAYFVIYANATTINLATTYANAMAGTKIATSSAGSGTHTIVQGGFRIITGGKWKPTSGYLTAQVGSGVTVTQTAFIALGSIPFTAGTWQLNVTACYNGAASNSLYVLAVSTSSTGGGTVYGYDRTISFAASGGGAGYGTSLCLVITVTTATTYYITAQTGSVSAGASGILANYVATLLADH